MIGFATGIRSARDHLEIRHTPRTPAISTRIVRLDGRASRLSGDSKFGARGRVFSRYATRSDPSDGRGNDEVVETNANAIAFEISSCFWFAVTVQ
jgi:hypothetical protein